MTNVLERIRQCDSLPTLPAAALKVLEMTGDEASLNQLAEMITQDAALSAKILRAVNSPLYGLPQKMSSIQQAVPLLGLDSVKMLVLSFSLVSKLRDSKEGGFDFVSYWRRSMYSATAARILSAEFLKEKQEECFVAALLMDIGTVLLRNVLHEQYDSIHERAHSHQDLTLLERFELGVTHADVAAIITKQWGLPDSLVVPISGHHGPQDVADDKFRAVAQLISLAGRTAEIFVTKDAADAISSVRRVLREVYKLDEAKTDALLTQIGQKTLELAGLFEIKLNATNFEQILTTASQRLLELSLAERDEGNSDKRKNKRTRRDGKISVIPCARGVLARAIHMKLRDVSAAGIGLICNGRLELGSEFLIQLPQPSGGVKSLLYTVRRCETSNGISDIGGELVSVLRPPEKNDKNSPSAILAGIKSAK